MTVKDTVGQYKHWFDYSSAAIGTSAWCLATVYVIGRAHKYYSDNTFNNLFGEYYGYFIHLLIGAPLLTASIFGLSFGMFLFAQFMSMTGHIAAVIFKDTSGRLKFILVTIFVLLTLLSISTFIVSLAVEVMSQYSTKTALTNSK